MSESTTKHNPADLAAKIARLAEEKGWNQEDFANIADLNRQTIRQILQPTGKRRLRNATIAACAKALGLSVNELKTLPVERLLQRLRQPPPPVNGDNRLHRLYQQATQPELRAWLDRNPERSRELTDKEIDELLALQGEALNAIGVETFVCKLERRRNLMEQVRVVADSELLEALETIVGLMFDKVSPYHEGT
ncbi:MAG TPA: helix-turn-helix transcriptional regulator [Gemmataceae bacterium]|nr:helix-turn-helix transcriptional regulator [Gemmataceae bacterium]